MSAPSGPSGSAASSASAALITASGPVELPAFVPDGTYGSVRAVEGEALRAAGVRAVMVNALHLERDPGVTLVRAHGGIHRFMGFDGPVFTDSGGFQAFSIATKVTDRGVTYKASGGDRLLSPQRSIETQVRLSSDLAFCLDYCAPPKADRALHEESVRLTVAWARQCRETFDRLVGERPLGSRPLLFGVVQGGPYRDLRARCADELLALGFDGFGYGGYPISDDGALVEQVELVASLLPTSVAKHGLGIGTPENVVAAWVSGYRTFDCVLPTRNGRHGRVYVRRAEVSPAAGGERFYDVLRLDKEHYYRDTRPMDENCAGECCRRYTRAYLSHMFRHEDPLAARLATLHNLRFYNSLVAELGP